MCKKIFLIIFTAASLLSFSGCKKFLEIAPPINTITTGELFSDSKQAEWAVAGLYSKMIHGLDPSYYGNLGVSAFGAGLCTIMGGLSSDEYSVANASMIDDLAASNNKLTIRNMSKVQPLWTTAYKLIYDANAVLEGLSSSSASKIQDSIRNQLKGETLTLRAFAYFYLVNFFGDLPLALTTDFNTTNRLSRSPVSKVYDQIKADLITAKPMLSTDLSVGKGEKVRVNRWFAEALLARVYLYSGEYERAITSANEVIGQTELFSIEYNIDNVFLKQSPEAIFQLKPASENPNIGNTIPEAEVFGVPASEPDPLWLPPYSLSNELMNAFESGDKRKTAWTVKKLTHNMPWKYKNNQPNAGSGQTEYYIVMRLAEMYLVRAEATVLLSPAAKGNAINDLNILRGRAGLLDLDQSLTAEQVRDAIAQERRVELFSEWAHRWFDLKRTGKAATVLPAMANKQPWWGNFQFLYPIPTSEIQVNAFLEQNPEYNSR